MLSDPVAPLTRDRRVGRWPLPSVLDVALAGSLVGIGLAEVATGQFSGPPALAAAVQVASLGAVVLRRLAPLPAIAASAAIYLPHVVVYGAPGSLAQLFAGLVLLHAVGRYADVRGAWAGGAIALLLVVVQGLRGALASPADWTFALVLSSVAVGVGRAQRRQAERARRLAREAADALRRQVAVRAAAVAEERSRIARELHDIVAHEVGLIALQAGGARTMLATDAERSREALERIEATAREALSEMRELVGILRDGSRGTHVPLPRLADLPALVEGVRAAGLTVELEVADRVPSAPVGVEVAAFRIVQEALTNVQKHAPGAPVHVRVCTASGVLTIEVINGPGEDRETPTAPHGGHGLIGMAERLRVYGGSLSAEPRPDGGFRVAARLPLGGGAT